MAFWDAVFTKKDTKKKHQVLMQVTDIFDKEIAPGLQQQAPVLEIAQIWERLLRKFSIGWTASLLYAKIASLDTQTMLYLGDVMAAMKDFNLLEIFLQHCSVQNQQDRIFILLGRLLHHARKKTPFPPSLIHHILALVENALGSKAQSAIWQIVERKFPRPIQDIAYIRGTITIPLFPHLLKWVVKRSPEVRQAAITAMVNVMEHDEKVIPVLVKALKDPKSQVCKTAAHALTKIGPKTIPFIQPLFHQASSRVKISMIWTLGHFQEHVLPMVPDFLAVLLHEQDPKLQKLIEWALIHIGKNVVGLLLSYVKTNASIEHLVLSCLHVIQELKPNLEPELLVFLQPLIQHPNPSIRAGAIGAMGDAGCLSKQILLHALADSMSEVQAAAIRGSSCMPGPVPEAIPLLVNLAQAGNDELRCLAIAALGQMKNVEPNVISILKLCLRDPKLPIQNAAIQALGKLAAQVPDLLQLLIEHYQNNIPEEIFLSIISIIAKIGMGKDLSLTFLLKALQRAEPTIQLAGLVAIEQMGIFAQSSIPAILNFLGSSDPEILSQAIQTLVSIGHTSSNLLLQLAVDATTEIRLALTQTLIKIGTPAIPELIHALTGNSSEKRRVAVDVLGNLGELAMPALLNLMDYEDFWVRKAIARALEKNGRIAIPYLLQILQQPNDPMVLAMALEVLKKMKQKALPILLPLMSDPNPRLSQLAIQAIKQVGPEYQEIIPEILQLTKHQNPMIRRAAIWCLERIQVPSPEIIAALQAVYQSDPDAQVREGAGQTLEALFTLADSGTQEMSHKTLQE